MLDPIRCGSMRELVTPTIAVQALIELSALVRQHPLSARPSVTGHVSWTPKEDAMTQHVDQPPPPARQPPLGFTREGPDLPRTAMRECQALLTQLLVEVIRAESASMSKEAS